MTRRTFAGLLGAAASQPRPNVLWITCEDIGPHLGCYGDRYSVTPNLDRLAAGAVRYRTAWSNAPVCAPARTTIISGMYPPATGSEHMRSLTSLPAGMRMYPCHLREAGYYVSNNAKEDYNLEHTGRVWDEFQASAPTCATALPASRSSPSSTSSLRMKARSAPGRTPGCTTRPARALRLLSPGYPGSPPGLGAVLLRQLSPQWTARRARSCANWRRDGPGARHHRLLLWRPRLGHAPQQTLALQLGPACAPAGAHSEALPPPGAQGLRFRRASQTVLVSFVDLAPTLLSLCGVRPPANMHGHAFME